MSSHEPRARRARSSLTTEEILDAAEHVAASGYDALTVRAVAVTLGAAPMSLYRYFATKDDLVDAMLNRVFGRIAPLEETSDWTADVIAFARAHRRLLEDHPWAVIPIFTHPNPGANTLRIGEMALGIFERGGLDRESAVIAFENLLALNYGWSAFALSRSGLEESNRYQEQQMEAGLAALPMDVFPRTVAAAPDLSRYGSERHYELALEQLLAGIITTAGWSAQN